MAVVERSDEDVDVARSRFGRAHRAAVVLAGVFAVSISARAGLGLAIFVLAIAAVTAWAISEHNPKAARWCAAAMVLAPWLVIRDNVWLTISIVATTMLVAGVASFAAATEQSVADLSLGALGRRTERRSIDRPPPVEGQARTVLGVVRGLVLAVPVVFVFWVLLAWADQVFAQVVDPSFIPFGRSFLFVFALPFTMLGLRFAVVGRPSASKVESFRTATLEASIVLGAVSALFSVFIVLRVATVGRSLEDLAFRSEVRSGFFQLLWVAALTVALVLLVRQVLGPDAMSGRLRLLAIVTIALAAVIDVLAMVRIYEYVEQSFWSPLRFWSFGFGLWLLVVLGMTVVRMGRFRHDRTWFTAALVSSWLVFVFAMAVVNPDNRIATHNFENPPTGEDEWIAVNPLIWLSEDATPTIVDNIEVLRPLPDNRYGRMLSHLCSRPEDTSWRHFHLSRRTAHDAIAELC